MQYKNMSLLSYWSSYIVQLPFYSSHSFNSDKTWQHLFYNHWAADWAYYNSTAFYAGDDGRYGIGAGFTDKWCSAKNSGYEADMLVPVSKHAGEQGCRIYSPYSVAGYLPAAPQIISQHLLALMASGESVLAVPQTFDESSISDFVLLRKSLLEPGWNQNDHVSMVDFSSELFGLSTIWLGLEFFSNYTNHWPKSKPGNTRRTVVV